MGQKNDGEGNLAMLLTERSARAPECRITAFGRLKHAKGIQPLMNKLFHFKHCAHVQWVVV